MLMLRCRAQKPQTSRHFDYGHEAKMPLDEAGRDMSRHARRRLISATGLDAQILAGKMLAMLGLR